MEDFEQIGVMMVAAVIKDAKGREEFYVVFGDLSSRTGAYSNWSCWLCEFPDKNAMNAMTDADVVELVLANLDDGRKVSVDSRIINLDPRLVAWSIAEELLDDSNRKLHVFTNELF